jgi:hypothetical protein
MTNKQLNRKGNREMQKFYKWMAVKVKSVHLSNNEKMSEAYTKVFKSATTN